MLQIAQLLQFRVGTVLFDLAGVDGIDEEHFVDDVVFQARTADPDCDRDDVEVELRPEEPLSVLLQDDVVRWVYRYLERTVRLDLDDVENLIQAYYDNYDGKIEVVRALLALRGSSLKDLDVALQDVIDTKRALVDYYRSNLLEDDVDDALSKLGLSTAHYDWEQWAEERLTDDDNVVEGENERGNTVYYVFEGE